MNKVLIRFFNDREVRAVWDEECNKWWFSVVDIVAILSESEDAENYWHVLKNRLTETNSKILTNCKGFKLTAPDGKKRETDCIDNEGVVLLAENFPDNRAMNFLDRFTSDDNSIDEQSKKKAYTFWDSNLIDSAEVGSIKALQKIHAYIFDGLYDFAGQIRDKNISKGGFTFAPCRYFHVTLPTIERMPETTFDEIVDKYVEMNVVHPFMEGNGRSMRIWLDLMFKRSLKMCVDWSKIKKNDYMNAMIESLIDSTKIKQFLRNALTDKIHDSEIFMKGIDYSYYYEEN